MFVDAHNHILDYLEMEYQKDEFSKSEIESIYPAHLGVAFCASSNERMRFIKQKNLSSLLPESVRGFYSFGVHPQAPSVSELPFLESLLKNKEIIAIGECGFDLFSDEYKKEINEQKEVWNVQIDLAIKYEVPIIIHCRRALHLIFKEEKKLARLNSVIFHGWPGSKIEAVSLLKRRVNAYFCIGKALLRRQKSQIEMAKTFDPSRLLTETDCPYMSLKGEAHSLPANIENVAERVASLREMSLESLNETLCNNFCDAFSIKKSLLGI